jgi:uncharacterized membrane protein
MFSSARPFFPRPITLAILFFIFGLFYLALTPPGQVPDEKEHFYRAFQISDGIMTGVKNRESEGGYIPVSLDTDFRALGDLYVHPEIRLSFAQWKKMMAESLPLDQTQLSNRSYQGFPVMVLYSPITYLPQAIAIRAALLFELKGMNAFYLARFTCLLFTSFCVYLCFGLLAFSNAFSLIFLLLLAMPMSMFQLSSMSADVVTDCLAFLCSAAAFSLVHKWQRNVFVLLLISAAGLSFCKTLYLLIPLAAILPVFLQPQSEKPERLRRALLLLVCTFLPCLIWSLVAKGSYVPVRGNVPEQLKFVLGHPFFYLNLVAASVVADGKGYLWAFVGVLGGLDAPLPWKFVLIYLSFLVGASLGLKPPLDKVNTWLNLGLVGATVFGVILSQYLYWSFVGSSHIEGIQGRYFIPLAPLFFFSLPSLRLKFLSSPYFTYCAMVLCFAAQIVGVRTLLLRYWF